METTSWVFVIDSKVTYNVLLGRPWIHSSNVVPSTLHQCLKYYKDGSKKAIKTDEDPITVEESHFTDEKCYQRRKTSEAQLKEEPEAHRATQLSPPNAEEEFIKALEGSTLPLTQAKKIASIPLKGFVTPIQRSKIEHQMLNPKTDDLLVKAGSDPVKDAGMGKLPPEVTESKMH
ncbi:hypothetical protein LIER_35760 [Lithospermum erythrorhizon]|uniref:Uncharacterized protein n=1 Tax=Lithospermum erythrorhizon TaxID=34254 RepID=A0AAV3NW29_LITER